VTLEVPAEFLAMPPRAGGTSSYILQSDTLAGWLQARFGSSGLCLKVFPGLTSPESEWEFVPLSETVVVQNLFAAEGWAPRVHALVKLGTGPMAEVVDYAEGLSESPPDDELLRPFWALVDRHRIGTRSRTGVGGGLKWDFLHERAGRNWPGCRVLDWGGKYRRNRYPQWDEPQPRRSLPGPPVRITCAEAIWRGQECNAMIYDLNRHDVADWQLAWVWCLAQIAPDGPAVECGVAHGGSLACWAAARVGRGPIVAVDTKFREGALERLQAYGYEVDALQIASWDAPARIPGEVAFCFVDAEHSEPGISRDIAVWPDKIMPGGILALHDYGVWKPNVAVKQYVDQWQAEARWDYLGQIGALIAFRRPGE